MIRLMLAVMLCGVLAVGCNPPAPAAPKAENTKAKAAASVGAAGAIIKSPAITPVAMMLATSLVTNVNFSANPAVAKVAEVSQPAPSAGSTPAQCATDANGACVNGACGVATTHQSYGYSYGSRRMFRGRVFGGGRMFGGRMFGRCRGGC